MTVMWETIAREGVQFFGKMSASLSHELKNALAILNENAGLVMDLTSLAEQGRPLEPARLKNLSNRMTQQIQRADTLIKRMNRFAHSADLGFQVVDLAVALEPIVAIAERPAAMKSAQVSLVPPGHPVHADTYLFLLENLIWLAIDHLLATDHKEIQLFPETTGSGARIRVKGQFDLSINAGLVFPSRRELMLIEALKAELFIDAPDGEMTIFLPKIV